MDLRNKLNREEALKKIASETEPRQTISFYRYVQISDPRVLRDQLYQDWTKIGVVGRIYIANEGINAQLSIPCSKVDDLRNYLNSSDLFDSVPLKFGLEEPDISFWKLSIKVKKQIVADGLMNGEYDLSDIGTHLDPAQFNRAIENGAIVVDMRNGYESRIGRFEDAICLPVKTFREQLPETIKALKDKKDEKILLYCTGGIRCEKASAYLKHKGYKNVSQLKGGIIDYKRVVDKDGLDCKFIGKNYVFDGRKAETVTTDVLTHCDTCKEQADTYVDCMNLACHLLFVQCSKCQKELGKCCSKECQLMSGLSKAEQKELRKGKKKDFSEAR